MVIVITFIIHWYLTAIVHGLYIHRYRSHRQFYFLRNWDLVFHLFTYMVTGPAYLDPKTYSMTHKKHHRFSDKEGDPHSPIRSKSFLHLLWDTQKNFRQIRLTIVKPQQSLAAQLPSTVISRALWVLLYLLFYYHFATSFWSYLLLPIHLLMLHIQGALINWLGHKYGYKNFDDLNDNSRNTLSVDFLFLGELMQHNHHRSPVKPNNSVKHSECDPLYLILRGLAKLSIIKFRSST